MFLIRNAKLDDATTLLKLAKLVHSNNLPPDPDIIRSRIRASRDSFRGRIDEPTDRLFLFVLEDTDTGHVIGSALVAPHVGAQDKPHLYLHARKRENYSTDLQTGQVHMTLQLMADTTPHTEIGGLILSPGYRGHRARLGSLLSQVRFNFIGMHREQFCDRIVAEMMAPLTPDSRNSLWEYLGRRFINLSYEEADRFCQHSKEFILALFPKEEIYVSLLPPIARNLIGRVGPETEPAKMMLERLGFQYKGHVDPFDGGPYLEANVDEVPLVRETRPMTIATGHTGEFGEDGFVSVSTADGFRAIRCPFAAKGDTIYLSDDDCARLNVEAGNTVGVTNLAWLRRLRKSKHATQGLNAP